MPYPLRYWPLVVLFLLLNWIYNALYQPPVSSLTVRDAAGNVVQPGSAFEAE